MTITQQEQNKKNNVLFCNYYESREKFDLSLMIDATNSCQLRCGYCYYGNKGSQKMRVSSVLAAASNLSAIFEPKLKEVNFHYMGGEPLLAWEEILELNATARRSFEEKGTKFTWSLTSNLIALDERKTKHMLKEKAGIHCSIDGPAKIHDKNRPYANGKPSFADVVKNIPLALQITPDDTARVTVLPEDAGSLPEIAETILGLGFKVIGLFPAYNMPWDQKAIEKWAEGIAEAHKETKKVYQHRKKISTIIKLEQRKKVIDRFTYCGAGKGLWAIGVDGKLYFCHHLTNTPEFAIINASQNTPAAIRTAIEESILPPRCEKIPETCIDCPARNHCNGGCWTSNLLANGDSANPEKNECKLRVATFLSLRNSAQLILQSEHQRNCGRCYDCENCYGGCESCQRTCESSCQSCLECQTCDDCQKTCEHSCKHCDSCQFCDSCLVCDSCQSRCERSCQGCEKYCQGCDTGCQGGCQSCDTQQGPNSW